MSPFTVHRINNTTPRGVANKTGKVRRKAAVAAALQSSGNCTRRSAYFCGSSLHQVVLSGATCGSRHQVLNSGSSIVSSGHHQYGISFSVSGSLTAGAGDKE
eukprot:TRINITY_DN18406_c0_g1_i1.p1 TRINITY_DN18406_c0_g1~~TRINITY_DN18406_c0_g1_i1.p1  ORF type:complete len:102 (-),score=12.60 TRINITY_DN18406_c0_g1_i1:104-409(-)